MKLRGAVRITTVTISQFGGSNKGCVYSGIATEKKKPAKTTAKQQYSLLGSSTKKVQITHVSQGLSINPRFLLAITMEKILNEEGEPFRGVFFLAILR